MSDFHIDWGHEDGSNVVDHDGGPDVFASDHQFDLHHDFFHGTESSDDHFDQHIFGEVDDEPHHHIEELNLPEPDQDFNHDGSYELVGADPDESDLWNQIMVDFHEDVNPYAAN